jgi:hypothetical protein
MLIEYQKDIPSEGDIKKAAEVLSRLAPGKLPLPIFTEILRLGVLTAYEVVPVRVSEEGKVQVLLTERPTTDPWWPGELHAPGVMVIPTDEDFEQVHERLMKVELGEGIITQEPVHVRNIILETKRGIENANIHYMQIMNGKPNEGTFYDIDKIPFDRLISHHQIIIPTAIAAFNKSRENE